MARRIAWTDEEGMWEYYTIKYNKYNKYNKILQEQIPRPVFKIDTG